MKNKTSYNKGLFEDDFGFKHEDVLLAVEIPQL